MTRLVNTDSPIYRAGLDLVTRVVVEPKIGARYLTTARWLDDFWSWSESDRIEWRELLLADTLLHAGREVPFYRDLAVGAHTPLDQLPVTDKRTIGDGGAHLADDRARHPAVLKHTGGSTGDAWNYPLDRKAWAHAYGAQIHRFGQLGVDYGESRLTLGFPTSLGLENLSLAKRLRFAVENNDVSLSGLDVGPAASLDRVRRALARDVRFWYGYAGTIAGMARAVLDSGQQVVGPSLIVTMAEPLWPAWRADIEEAFGSRVVEEYGANDGGVMSHRCGDGNFHLADHQSIVEVLDGDRVCGEGEEGEIVVTNLHARHLPFIRYRIGDLGVVGPAKCPCGGPGRTLASVSGRSGDVVVLPDGTHLVPQTFFNPFNELTSTVRRWQAVQTSPEHLELRLEVGSGYGPPEADLLRTWVVEQTRGLLEVTIAVDQEFVLTRGGKHKIVVREF